MNAATSSSDLKQKTLKIATPTLWAGFFLPKLFSFHHRL
ncbi:hypothetical protein HM1_2481 [Heliomicrobium modesticaldum Ice1]|uniref:Uncharacterized protein n=1 Tax=Heliobacterium modesticaldum (strain ATCC 51547 / Ice1) TaxID=498761 RepID=B0TAI0_HELMI|nr:hypothetical protein HM1_2481 [Heliomicrobium modesticaldum Ice1]